MRNYQNIKTLDSFSGWRNRSRFHEVQNEAINITFSSNKDISNYENNPYN
jgi:hypothetical protein